MTVAPIEMGRGGRMVPSSHGPPRPPISPDDRTDRIEPTDPIESTDPTDPIDRNDPTEPTDSVDPIDPNDSAEPTDPADRNDARLANESVLRAERTERSLPVESTDRRDPMLATEPSSSGRGRRDSDDRSHARASSGEEIMPEAYGRGAAALANGGPRTFYSSAVAATTAPRLRPVLKRQVPGLDAERALWAAGHEVVVGMDEVGRGSWAGPLSIGAVVLPRDRRVNKVRDSKQLTEAEREKLYVRITERAIAFSVVVVEVEEIDRINIFQATMHGMRRALLALHTRPEIALVDGNRLPPDLPCPARAIIGGDDSEPAIGAASILAKVTRDRLMCELDVHHPEYGFARHKGYSTPEHFEALRTHGPCVLHRRSFAPVRAALQGDFDFACDV